MNSIKEITKFDHLSVEENLDLYLTIKDKLLNRIYSVKYIKLGSKLSDKAKVFSELSIYEQCNIIIQLITILHSNLRTGDLTLIGESKQSGSLTIGNKIAKTKDVHSFKIIHQSVTGLFEQEIELLN